MDAFGGYLGYLPGSFNDYRTRGGRAAHSSRRDAVSKRIDQLAADVADLQRELARIKAERECACPTCAVGLWVRAGSPREGSGSRLHRQGCSVIASVEGSSDD